jgi:thiazole/oxazole-forming peptide maturase SagC family component
MENLSQCDLTTRYDGLDTEYNLDQLAKKYDRFKAIVVAVSSPCVSLLRTLNRIAVQNSQMMSFAILDGPFLTAFSVKPTETACFECFENRVLARIESLSAYRSLVGSVRLNSESSSRHELVPLLNTFASLPIFEAFLYIQSGKAKLAGRVINVFIPSIEIQVQDLLRIPSCPACGFVAKAHLEEMYTATKQLVDGLVDRVEIIG